MAAADDGGATARRFVAAAGLTFEVLEYGDGDRLALCLHGFPSQAICSREQLPLLASLGYRAWAPSLRGYGRTSRPERVADCTIDNLLGDIAALIDASGAGSTVLIAQDWGGLLAWFFAARRVRPLEKLIILNAPHPAVAAVAYRRWRQMRKAWYMLAFQVPWLPDFLLRFNQAWLVGRLRSAITSAGRDTVGDNSIARSALEAEGHAERANERTTLRRQELLDQGGRGRQCRQRESTDEGLPPNRSKRALVVIRDVFD